MMSNQLVNYKIVGEFLTRHITVERTHPHPSTLNIVVCYTKRKQIGIKINTLLQ